MFTDIQRGDKVFHVNGVVAKAASGVGFNSCGDPIISAKYPDSEGGFYIPWYVALIVRVERSSGEPCGYYCPSCKFSGAGTREGRG